SDLALMASVRVASLLARNNKQFQVLGDRVTSYNDLRGRPAILLGEFNNRWTTGLTKGLRFYLEKNRELHRYEVLDRQQPGKVLGWGEQSEKRPEEYAIVTRVFDSSTERSVIAISGMTYMGTN